MKTSSVTCCCSGVSVWLVFSARRVSAPGDPAEGLVVGGGDLAVDRSGDHGFEGELEEGEAARLSLDVGEHLVGEPVFEHDAGVGGGPFDRFPQLGGGGHRQRQAGLGDDRAQQFVAEGVVVEVGPEGGHHPDPAADIGGGLDQALDEQPAHLVGGDSGVELFELVDHQHQFPFEGGHDPLAQPQQPSLVGGELGHHVPHRFGGHLPQSGSQLVEGIRAGNGGHRHPFLGAGEGPVAQGGDQPGPHQRRLPRPRRPNDHHHPVLRHQLEETAGLLVAAEEIFGVVDLEGTQPLVRVAGQHRQRRRRPPPVEGVEPPHQRVNRIGTQPGVLGQSPLQQTPQRRIQPGQVGQPPVGSVC
jgi:hypothetical protein